MSRIKHCKRMMNAFTACTKPWTENVIKPGYNIITPHGEATAAGTLLRQRSTLDGYPRYEVIRRYHHRLPSGWMGEARCPQVRIARW